VSRLLSRERQVNASTRKRWVRKQLFKASCMLQGLQQPVRIRRHCDAIDIERRTENLLMDDADQILKVEPEPIPALSK